MIFHRKNFNEKKYIVVLDLFQWTHNFILFSKFSKECNVKRFFYDFTLCNVLIWNKKPFFAIFWIFFWFMLFYTEWARLKSFHWFGKEVFIVQNVLFMQNRLFIYNRGVYNQSLKCYFPNQIEYLMEIAKNLLSPISNSIVLLPFHSNQQNKRKKKKEKSIIPRNT